MKICAITGGRADWGLLSPVLAKINDHSSFSLDIVATGQHLIGVAGDTLSEIARDGFCVSEQLNIQFTTYDSIGITKSMGCAIIGFADIFAKLQPELLIVLGDRYEILAAVQAALIARIPVAHLCGGDITEGAMDDAIRHAITKMSHLHFVTNELSATRVRQMGEATSSVHCVGSTGLDRIRLTPTMNREVFFKSIGFEPCRQNLLVTFHPVTLDLDPTFQIDAMLSALEELPDDIGFIFTGVNADPGASKVGERIKAFVSRRKNAIHFGSLGGQRYFSALRHVDAVVGNSSSGLYEAPSFDVPTLNIGDRQKGRLRSTSVIDVPADANAILSAIEKALSTEFNNVTNPYGDGHAAEKIISVLEKLKDPSSMLKKRFYDLEDGA